MKRIVFILALFFALVLLFAACGEEMPIEQHVHTPSTWDIEKEATCTEPGIKNQYCATCGEPMQSASIPATGHTPGEWIIDQEPTCTEAGSKHQVCSTCGETIKAETIQANGHKKGEWITIKEPTCTEKGEKNQVCSVCNEVLTIKMLDATGHTPGEWIIDQEPTCTETGNKHRICTVCGETEKVETSANGHTPGEWITDQEPTCTEVGSKHRICVVCGEEETTEISAPGHIYVNRVCTICGDVKQYSDGLSFVSNGNGTCYVSGKGNCTDTDISIPEVSPAGDRIVSIGYRAFYSSSLTSIIVPENIDSIGDQAFYGCTQMKSFTFLSETVPSIGSDVLGQTWDSEDFKIIVPERSLNAYKSVTAGYWQQYAVKRIAFSHSYGEWTIQAVATCTSDGKKTRTCAVCGNEETVILPATGHSGEWTIDQEPTCAIAGSKHQVCTICGETIIEEIPVIEHLYGEWIVDQEPTCTKGTKYQICSVCGAINQAEIPPINDHCFTFELHPTNCIQSEGKTIAKCKYCPETREYTWAPITVEIEYPNYYDNEWGYFYWIHVVNVHGGKIEIDEKGNKCNGNYQIEIYHTRLNYVIYSATVTENSFIPYPYASYNYNFSSYRVTITDGYSTYIFNSYITSTAPSFITTLQETIIPYDHTGEWQTLSAPTCTTGGIETRTCTICGTVERRSISALGHSFGEWTVTKEVTCTKNGEREHTCSVCSILQKETIWSPGHQYSDWVTIKPATCEKGLQERTCSVCGYVEKQTLAADYTAHIWGEETCTVCGEHKASEGLQFEMVNGNQIAIWGYTGSDTTVYLPSSYIGCVVTTIRSEAFKDQTQITEIFIPASITDIASNAFSGCTGLEDVTISADYISRIPKDNLKTVVLNGGTSIGNYAFKGCTGLTSVAIPDSVTSIGYQAFYGCSGLTNVTIPNSVTGIEKYAFEKCTGLTSVAIGNGVKCFYEDAFKGCKSLTAVYITDIVKWCEITFVSSTANPLCYAHNLFLNGELVTNLIIPNRVSCIKNIAFLNCSSFVSITISHSVTSIGHETFTGCTGLTSIIVEDENDVYHGAGNCIIDTASKTLILGCKTSIIPTDGSVTSIGNSAFSGCADLTSVTIPKSVTSIGDGAFYGCSSLKSVTIPDSVTNINGSAFEWCTDLTNITIPNSVTYIGYFAFQNLWNAFYEGTKAQWNAISKDSYWNGFTKHYTIHCTDGDITE